MFHTTYAVRVSLGYLDMVGQGVRSCLSGGGDVGIRRRDILREKGKEKSRLGSY